MAPAHRPPLVHFVLAGILVAIFFWQSLSASLGKSPVFDEPPHIAAGLSYLETGVFHANLQHPPLLKEISALFLSLAGIHWPQSEQARAVVRGGPGSVNMEWPVGNDIIVRNGADRVMFWARLPFILLATLLGMLLYWWGRQVVGDGAALGALFLYALDPAILAHSYLVTTDMGLAAFTLLFMWSLWRYARLPSRRNLVICGVAMGAMLGAKFSALFLLPVAAVLLVAALRWPVGGGTAEAEAGEPDRVAKVAPNAACPCGSGRKFKKCHGAEGSKGANVPTLLGIPTHQLMARAGAFLLMCLVAAVVVEAFYFFPSDPFLYFTGLGKVNADHAVGYQSYLHGVMAKRFSSYFVMAYLLKEPLATLLLAGLGTIILWRRKFLPVMSKLFLLLPPLVILVAMSIFADDMGVRYLIPALPFTYLLGGLALAELCGRRQALGRCVAAVLCLWVGVAAAGIYPDHLSYFNESACLLEKPGSIGWDGGSKCGWMWLNDSNLDWGQGLKQLRAWMDQNGHGRTLRLSYFGTVPPETYGLRYENVGLPELMADPPPGLFAVSAHVVAYVNGVGEHVAPGAGSWVRRMAPVAVVGHAYYIYDVH